MVSIKNNINYACFRRNFFPSWPWLPSFQEGRRASAPAPLVKAADFVVDDDKEDEEKPEISDTEAQKAPWDSLMFSLFWGFWEWGYRWINRTH